MSTSIEDLTARAKQLIAERRYQEAVRACRRVLLSRPAMVEVRILLGMALLALKRHDEVRAEMMAVLRTAPDEATAHRLLGEAYLRDAQVGKARESLKRALELAPTDDEARELLGEVAAEEPPSQATVDRWFDPEAVSTVQTDVPSFDDEQTSALSVRHADVMRPAIEDTGELANEPTYASVPELANERTIARPPSVRAPSVRPRPPPPRAVPMGRTSSFPPPPGSNAAYPGSAGGPRRPVIPSPASFPPAQKAPQYDLGGAMAAHHEIDTGAHSPNARRDHDDPVTAEELALSDVEPIYPTPTPSPAKTTNAWHGGPPPPSDYDEPPTWARVPGEPEGGAGIYVPDEPEDPADFDRPSADDWRPLEEAKTVARPPPGDASMPTGAFVDHVTDRYIDARKSSRPIGPPGSPSSSPAPKLRQPRRERPPQSPAVIALVIGVPLAIGLLAFFTIAWWIESSAQDEILAATTLAEDDGALASLERALELAEDHDGDDPGDIALRSRLAATAVLEHRADREAQARALLEELEGHDAALPDAVIARAYLALASGDASAASVAVTAADATGEPSAELWRARSLTAKASGNLAGALDAARQASAARPTAPRHAALYALLTADNGDVQAALDALAGVREAESSPAVRVARARVVRTAGSDPERAEREATAVLTELEAVATPPQRAWARLIRAACRIEVGEPTSAIEDARAALADRPPGDELFALELAQLFLRAGAPEDAGRLLESLPEESSDRPRRARLRAAVALEVNDLDAADEALESAGANPQAEFLRGRLAEARGEADAAQVFYERAMARDSSLRVTARIRLGALALQRGEARRAIELLDEARELSPADVEVVPMLVEALLVEGQETRAREIVTVAFQVPRSAGSGAAPELLLARARVELATGETDRALATLSEVAELRPDDPEVQASIGDAALSTGDVERARTAFERAIALSPRSRAALLGLASLAFVSDDLDAVQAAITRAEAGGATGRDLELLQARLGVLRGEGEAVIAVLSTAARGSRDAELLVALGRACLQAERDNDALDAFGRAIRAQRDNPEALLGVAQVRARVAAPTAAGRAATEASRAAEGERSTPWFRARVLAVLGRVSFELGRYDDAADKATRAIELDERTSEAHLLRAFIAETTNTDMVVHLRRAVEGRTPPPEAIGLLAKQLGRGEEACTLARRYIAAAPNGYDAPDVRRILSRCR